MNKQTIGICAAFLAVTLSAACADGATVTFKTDSYGSTGGGEFIFRFNPAGTDFITFCVEYNEHIQVGKTYNATIATGASNGGVSGGNPDPLDSRTAFLYSEFVNQTLGNTSSLYQYHFADLTSTDKSKRTASANALQRAIWAIEGEMAAPTGTSFLAMQTNYFLGLANSAGWTDTGNVRVLHLETTSGGIAQDQLVIIPTPTALAGGGALMGVAGALGLRRKRLHAADRL